MVLGEGESNKGRHIHQMGKNALAAVLDVKKKNVFFSFFFFLKSKGCLLCFLEVG